MRLEGRISNFGGPLDPGEGFTNGLALYEHAEADRRPDLFLPRSPDPEQGTSKRLRTESLYIAIRFNKEEHSRDWWQKSMWKVLNPKTGQWVMCSLVDYGPHEKTGRIVDASPAVCRFLRVETDDEVEVICLTF